MGALDLGKTGGLGKSIYEEVGKKDVKCLGYWNGGKSDVEYD